MFPRWDLTWLLGQPCCLSFTFLWRLGSWLQLDEGHVRCLKASSCTKPSQGIIQTWLKSPPGAGSGRNFLPSFAEWNIVPFLTSSLGFHFRNSLMLPGLNTSLLFPCDMSLLQRLEETPTLELWKFLVYIGMDLMDLLSILVSILWRLCVARSPAATRRGTWWLGWCLQGQSSQELCWGIYSCAPSFVKLHDDKAWAHRLFPKQAPGTFLSW